MSFILGFWSGVAVTWGGMYLYQHPLERKALLAKVKALFVKKDSP